MSTVLAMSELCGLLGRLELPLPLQGVLDNAGFPSRVTAHFVAVDGQSRPRTTILIKFAEEVRQCTG